MGWVEVGRGGVGRGCGGVELGGMRWGLACAVRDGALGSSRRHAVLDACVAAITGSGALLWDGPQGAMRQIVCA